MKKPAASLKAALALTLVVGLAMLGFSDIAIPRLLMIGIMLPKLFILCAEIQRSNDFLLRGLFKPDIKGVLSHPWLLLGILFLMWKFFEIIDRRYGG